MDIMDEAERLYLALGDIEYGWMDMDGIVHTGLDDGEDFYKYYRLQSPSQIWQSGVGVCWDQVEASRHSFERFAIPVYTLYIQASNPEKASHTLFLFKDGLQWYWLEGAWGDKKGIHRIGSIPRLIKYVGKNLPESNGAFFVAEYKKPEYGISCQQFIDGKEGVWMHVANDNYAVWKRLGVSELD